MSNKIKVLLSILFILLLFSCSNDDDSIKGSSSEREKVKIAVILPFGENDTNWNNVLNLVKENITLANDSIEPEFELYDENIVDIENVAAELANRSDITAVIGCLYSTNTEILARKCAQTYKPVFTFSTSAELSRAFGKRGFLWCLVESDITQSELLLIKAESYGAKRVSLLAADNIYGQTFTDWFGFQAVELGMETVNMESYQADNIQSQFELAISENADYLICVPENVEDACKIANYYKQSEYTGRLLFSDVAYSESLISTLGDKSNGLEGIAITADPTTGFSVYYEVNFNENPGIGTACVYDAVMIACYAYRYAAIHDIDVNSAISKLLNQEAKETGMWTYSAMSEVFKKIESGETPAFSGASCNLDFSTDNYTTVLYSTYVHWMAYEGEFVNLDYDNRTSTGGSSMYAGWEWNKQYMQQFDDIDTTTITYPEHQGNWAVVVAASQGWINYRHQADALAFYQMLKSNGYDDDHIVLIMADDLANNVYNPEEGVVRRTSDGTNLYNDVKIDYKLSEITPENLQSILSGDYGNSSLMSGNGDNVIFFWSGHGEKGKLLWGENDYVSSELISNTFRKMHDEGKFRKMLCFIETCYSGSVAEACVEIPGILLFTAANGNETSKADNYNSELGVWMTNRFTSILLNQTSQNPDIALRDLYLTMFQQTIGSHVCVYNVENYGSVYKNTMAEYMNPLSN